MKLFFKKKLTSYEIVIEKQEKYSYFGVALVVTLQNERIDKILLQKLNE